MNAPADQRGADEPPKQNNGDNIRHDLFAVDEIGNLLKRRLSL
jgi:hypothetical protein